jgi:hypothetical protein
METWMIVAIVVAIALILYYMSRRKAMITVSPAGNAPGINASNGQVPTNQPLPGTNPPPVVGSNGILQHVPIVGGLASGIFHGTTNAALALDKGVGNALDHIPVVGHVLSAPTKIAGSIVKSVTDWF